MEKGSNDTLPLYKTYIFDLYGTLIDIKTDEDLPELWENLAGIYSAYGAYYSPSELKKAYIALCAEETDILRSELKNKYSNMNPEFPEIKLERVFARLLLEASEHSKSVMVTETSDDNGALTKSASGTHTTSATINGKAPSSLTIDELCESEWAYMIANTFRIISRERLSSYKNTISTLKALREKGCRLYLLSNAQGIFTRTELEMTGLLPYLDGIYISSEKQIKKPGAEFMEWLLKEFDIDKSSAVMVGNEMNCDMGIAKACGLPGIFLNTFGWSDKKIKEEMEKIGVTKDDITLVIDGDIIHILPQ